MLPCVGCAYRKNIPGDCHVRCVYDWVKHAKPEEIPMNENPKIAKWFRFPFNFDPTWGPDECAARSEMCDLAKVAPQNPWTDLLSLLR